MPADICRATWQNEGAQAPIAVARDIDSVIKNKGQHVKTCRPTSGREIPRSLRASPQGAIWMPCGARYQKFCTALVGGGVRFPLAPGQSQGQRTDGQHGDRGWFRGGCCAGAYVKRMKQHAAAAIVAGPGLCDVEVARQRPAELHVYRRKSVGWQGIPVATGDYAIVFPGTGLVRGMDSECVFAALLNTADGNGEGAPGEVGKQACKIKLNKSVLTDFVIRPIFQTQAGLHGGALLVIEFGFVLLRLIAGGGEIDGGPTRIESGREGSTRAEAARGGGKIKANGIGTSLARGDRQHSGAAHDRKDVG